MERDIQWARSRHNRRLKKIAQRVDIDENLTTYVARHSFATIAKRKNIPLAAIQELLGHTSIKTTEIYLDSLSSETLDEYQRKILEC
ncbi:MAG: tyrosine-type recombinase/integrase [Flavobacteriales bacterium]|nr:tyrosine-type recombinase/integrase [Flavobacteriales bacterium]